MTEILLHFNKRGSLKKIVDCCLHFFTTFLEHTKMNKMIYRLSVTVAVLSILTLGGVLNAATLTPVDFTGFNADTMWGVDGGNGGGFVRDHGPNIQPTHEWTSAAYFQVGALNTSGVEQTTGLPTGQFTSALDANHTYVLGAAGGGAEVYNTLLIQGRYDDVYTETLTLTTPGKFDTIGVLAHTVEDPASYGGNDMGVTLNFAGGGTYETTYFAADWCGSHSAETAISANRGQGQYDAMADSLDHTDSACNLYETVIDIPVAYQSMDLESITFAGLNGTSETSSLKRTTVIFAVSGQQVPEPGTLALLAMGLFGLICYAWRKRK